MTRASTARAEARWEARHAQEPATVSIEGGSSRRPTTPPAFHGPSAAGALRRLRSMRPRVGLASFVLVGACLATFLTSGTSTAATADAVSLREPSAPVVAVESVDPAGGQPGAAASPNASDLVVERALRLAETAEAVRSRQASVPSEAASSAPAVSAQPEPAAPPADRADFLWPTAGGVSSGFGPRFHPILHVTRLHNGADIGGECGQPIRAAQSGKVVLVAPSGYNGGSGHYVRIDHGDVDGTGLQTAYLHMARVEVKLGQQIEKGERIGTVGSTGLSTACHLHFSLYKNGQGSDPLEYLNR